MAGFVFDRGSGHRSLVIEEERDLMAYPMEEIVKYVLDLEERLTVLEDVACAVGPTIPNAGADEHRCAACGCSESRACDGGCVWATESLCSRCVR